MSDENKQANGSGPVAPVDNRNNAGGPPASREAVTSTPKPEPSFGIIDEGSRFKKLQPAQTRG